MQLVANVCLREWKFLLLIKADFKYLENIYWYVLGSIKDFPFNRYSPCMFILINSSRRASHKGIVRIESALFGGAQYKIVLCSPLLFIRCTVWDTRIHLLSRSISFILKAHISPRRKPENRQINIPNLYLSVWSYKKFNSFRCSSTENTTISFEEYLYVAIIFSKHYENHLSCHKPNSEIWKIKR